MLIIKTKKFTLRPYRLSDASAIAKNINNKKIYRYTLSIPYPYDLKDAKDYLKRLKPSERQGKNFSLAIVINNSTFPSKKALANREVVGCVSLMKIEKNHKAELGYWLAEEYWSQGIISEAVKLITDYGFKKLKLKRIYAYVFIKNLASQKVLIKNGFIKEGFHKKDVLKDKKLIDVISFAKVK